MLPNIGHNYLLADGRVVHCQDRDVIKRLAKVGIPDGYDIVWDQWWVPFEDLGPVTASPSRLVFSNTLECDQ